MERAQEYHHPIYTCFIDLKRHRICSTAMLFAHPRYYLYRLPLKFLASNYSYPTRDFQCCRKGWTSFCYHRFPARLCVGTYFIQSLYFDVAIHMALDKHGSQGMGIKVACLYDADLVRNRKILRFEYLVTDLEYADDMALLSDNWFDLTTTLDSLSNSCKKVGLAITCKKTKTLVVLPSECSHIQTSVPIHLVPRDEPIEVHGLSFPVLGQHCSK